MPSNPYKDQQNCFSFVDKFMAKNLKELQEGIHINELLRQCLVRYSVSRNSVLRFIRECYVETGEVSFEHDMLIHKRFLE